MSQGRDIPPDSQITLILERLNRGEAGAYEELIPLVYEELRRRAARRLASQPGGGIGHTLQPTALVHEAFLKMLPHAPDCGSKVDPATWEGSRHFYNAAAEVMKQIVMNHARSKGAQKRGGGARRVELKGVEPISPAAGDACDGDWEALDRALGELKAMDARRHQVVMLRYFAGLTDAQTAAALGVSEKTVERDWAAAKVFLRARICEPDRQTRVAD